MSSQKAGNEDMRNAPRLYDTTLREGEQMIGISFSLDNKVSIARQLVRTGIRAFEAGFAAVSEEEQKTIRAVLETVGTDGVSIFSLARLLKKDIDAVMGTGLLCVTIYAPVSDAAMKAFSITSLQNLENGISRTLEYAKEKGLTVKFSCEHATRTPLERLLRLYRLATERGADYVSLPDTAGICTPDKMGEWVRAIKQEIPVPLSVHCHNDLGLALANSLAAAHAGADEIQVTVNGLGDRVGNTAMDEFVFASKVGYGIDLGIDVARMVELSDLVTELTGKELPSNKPILGRNAFRHKSGTHVKALLRQDLATYEPFPPECIGRQREIFFGKNSGRSNLRYICRQSGISLSETNESALVVRLKELAVARGGDLTSAEVLEQIKRK